MDKGSAFLDPGLLDVSILPRENGKGGMRKGGIGQVNRNTQQTNTNKLDFPIPPFLIPPFPISQLPTRVGRTHTRA